MSKTNYLQTFISNLQRTAGPYRCATSQHVSDHAASSSSKDLACFKSNVSKPSVNQP